MPNPDTLLSHIARHHAMWREDVATDALAFILTHSTPARTAFADFLNQGATDTPAITDVRTRHTLTSGASPDLECLGDDGQRLALVESKFWAGLTNNQPVAYWNALPADAPATLLFLAPAERINPGGLWDELAARLTKADHPLADPVHLSYYTTTARAQDDDQRRLMLTSWKTLLDHLQQSALAQSDWQALFEIAQLQGLATSVITGSYPSSDDNLKRLITNAARRMVDTGWADRRGSGVGTANAYWGPFMRLAGADAWFGINYDESRNSSRPLWLALRAYGKVTMAQLRCRLAAYALNEPIDWETRGGDFCIPIALSPGADNETAFNSIIDQLTRIAQLIDPTGPTYKDASNA